MLLTVIGNKHWNKTYRTRSCRELLADVKKDGYVLADLYDLDAIQIYPIFSGAEYEIRCYSVTIVEDEAQLTVIVAGNLKCCLSTHSLIF